jgi:hypothetical protein
MTTADLSAENFERIEDVVTAVRDLDLGVALAEQQRSA